MRLSSDFVFQDKPKGLEFVGDFEGYYKNVEDPWDQSGLRSGMASYYANSRLHLANGICRRKFYGNGLEIGCGHGHVVNFLNGLGGGDWEGVDISPTAIEKARQLYPNNRYFVGNVLNPISPNRSVDIVVLGQILWYVMHNLDRVVENCFAMLRPKGLLIISQAFFKDKTAQRYGQHKINGLTDATRVFCRDYDHMFDLVEARLEEHPDWPHDDGLIIFKVKK